MPSIFEKEEAEDQYTLFANVLAFHTGSNRNQSNLTDKAAKKALKSMAYKPVLANFCEIDGVRDFTSHDFEINEDGSVTYIERQVGCFTADTPYLEADKDHEGRMNAYAKIAIPREYTDAAAIIERKNGTKCSVELGVNELSYDSKNKELILEDVEVMGLTLLGVNPETGDAIQEGMEGAHVQIEDFSVENNSIAFNSKIINEIANAVISGLGNIADKTALYSKEGGKENLKFEELLNKYGKTAEDITFDYEGLSDEKLEEAFKTAFDGEDSGADPADPADTTDQDAADAVAALINALPETVSTTDEEQIVAAREAYDALTDEQKALISAEVLALLTGAEESLGEAQAAATNQAAADAVTTLIAALPSTLGAEDADQVFGANQAYESLTAAQKELVSSSDVEALKDAVDAVNTALANQEDPAPKKKRQNNELTYTVNINGEEKTFSVSLIDKLGALSELVNSTYGEADDTWYDVDAYDDEKYVIMHDYWRNKHYRQSYAVKKDVYSLKGDRVEVFAQWLTSDEITKLDSIKSNYEAVADKLAKYEAEPEKMEILNSGEYANIADTVEFAELKKTENHFDMSVDEVKAEADKQLLAYAKGNVIDFAEKKKKQVGMKQFGSKSSGNTGRYGKLFKK